MAKHALLRQGTVKTTRFTRRLYHRMDRIRTSRQSTTARPATEEHGIPTP